MVSRSMHDTGYNDADDDDDNNKGCLNIILSCPVLQLGVTADAYISSIPSFLIQHVAGFPVPVYR